MHSPKLTVAHVLPARTRASTEVAVLRVYCHRMRLRAYWKINSPTSHRKS